MNRFLCHTEEPGALGQGDSCDAYFASCFFCRDSWMEFSVMLGVEKSMVSYFGLRQGGRWAQLQTWISILSKMCQEFVNAKLPLRLNQMWSPRMQMAYLGPGN